MQNYIGDILSGVLGTTFVLVLYLMIRYLPSFQGLMAKPLEVLISLLKQAWRGL